MNYVYIVQCKDGTLYTGWAADIEKRLAEHNQGKGAKYTRGRCPVILRYLEEYPTKQEACQREYCIKQLSRTDKLKLISENPVKEI